MGIPFEILEKTMLDTKEVDTSEKMETLHDAFKVKDIPLTTNYENLMRTNHPWHSIAKWVDTDSERIIDEGIIGESSSIYDLTKRMFSGIEIGDKMSLGLEKIHQMKRNPEYYEQNLRQQAGFAAEVISTAKENFLATLDDTGFTTVRADDLPKHFPKNDQYVDKVRLDRNNNIIERIQTKFVGDNGKECLDRLMSKKFEKYITDGMVDKIEIPKEHYEEIFKNKYIEKMRKSLENQIKVTTEKGKIDIAEKHRHRLDNLNKLENMLEKSLVSVEEAKYAVEHPDRYVKKIFREQTARSSHREGLSQAKMSVIITTSVSAVKNYQMVIDGKMTPKEAFVDLAKDSGTAAVAAYGVGFATEAVTQGIKHSSHSLIKSLGRAGVPAAMISFGVDSYDCISDFAQGEISEQELAVDLGENAAGILGSAAVSAAAGAAAGSIVPGAGTIVGGAAGLVGGMVGYAATTELYNAAIEYGAENADEIADKAKGFAEDTLERAKLTVPDKADQIKVAMNDFAENTNLPFRL